MNGRVIFLQYCGLGIWYTTTLLKAFLFWFTALMDGIALLKYLLLLKYSWTLTIAPFLVLSVWLRKNGFVFPSFLPSFPSFFPFPFPSFSSPLSSSLPLSPTSSPSPSPPPPPSHSLHIDHKTLFSPLFLSPPSSLLPPPPILLNPSRAKTDRKRSMNEKDI